MVVNEVTSTVQAKGTKTVVAAAVAALVAGGAVAADEVKYPVDGSKSWEGTTVTAQKALTATEYTALVKKANDTKNPNQAKDKKTLEDFQEAMMKGGLAHVTDKNFVITGSTVSNNSFEMHRGIVNVEKNGTVNIENSIFDRNTSGFGAVRLVGASVEGTITGSTFTNNVSRGHGGAIFVHSTARDNILIKESSFEENHADGTSNPGKAGNGGAIAVTTGNAKVEGGKFLKNEAKKNGGAISASPDPLKAASAGSTVTLKNIQQIEGNTAGGLGGALYLSKSTLNLEVTKGKDFVYQGNKAGTDAENADVKAYGRAGDFMFAENGSIVNFKVDGALTIKDSILTKSDNTNQVIFNKTGAGTLTAADMTGFIGNLNVTEGKMVIEGGIAEFDVNAQTNANTAEAASQTLQPTNVVVHADAKKTAELVMGDVKVNHAVNFNVTGADSTLTMNSLTVGVSEYKDLTAKDASKAKVHQYAGVAAFSGDATIANGVNVLKVKKAGSETETLAGNLNIAQDTTITVGGESKNEGTITIANAADQGHTAGELNLTGKFTNAKDAVFGNAATGELTIADNGAFVNEEGGSVKVGTINLSGIFQTKMGETTYTNLNLDDNAKFIVTGISKDKPTLEVASVDFHGGNFYSDENTAFDGILNAKGTVNFRDDYTFKTLKTIAENGQINVTDGTVTVSDSLEGHKDGSIATGTYGVISIAADKVFVKADKDGVVTFNKGDKTYYKIDNNGKLVLTGLTGKIEAKNLVGLKGNLVADGSKGLVDFGALTISDLTAKDGAIVYDATKFAGLEGSALEQFKNVTVTKIAAASTVNKGVALSGSYGALKYVDGVKEVDLGANTLELNNGGLLVSSKNEAVKLNLQDGTVPGQTHL